MTKTDDDPSEMTKADLEVEVLDLRSEVRRLRRSLETAEAAHQAADSRAEQAHEGRRKAEAAATQLEAELDATRKELTVQTRQADSLRAANAELAADVHAAKAATAEAERSEAALQRDRDRFQILLDDGREHLERERTARREAEGKLEQLKGAVTAIDRLLQAALYEQRGW